MEAPPLLDPPAFRAPAPLRSGRLMTLAAALPRRGLSAFDAAAEPRVFPVGEGSAVLGLCHFHPRPEERPGLVVLHGMTGSARSGYAIGLAAKAWYAGFNVVRLNARNCGGTEALSQTLYHAALVDDPLRVLNALARDPGLPRLYLAGFSMGGNLALLTAADRAASLPSQLRGVVAVSPPLDLAACSRRCQSTRFNRALTRHFITEFEKMLRRREAHFPGRIDLGALDREMPLWDFDAAFTAPMAGFSSVEDYYAAGSLRGKFDRIRLPTLIVHAIDDPLIPAEPFGDRELVEHARVRRLLTDDGGHVGFVGSAPSRGPRGLDPDRRWAENRVLDFLVALEAAS